ncbi:MAG: hypothetical protein Q9166_000991 [cf. Caloplaca sp. 2 TL-2023]
MPFDTFRSKHFAYTLNDPFFLVDTYHCKSCESNYCESQRYIADNKALQGLHDRLREQHKASKELVGGSEKAMEDLWRKEVGKLQVMAEGWVEEMKDIKNQMNWATQNMDQC